MFGFVLAKFGPHTQDGAREVLLAEIHLESSDYSSHGFICVTYYEKENAVHV